MQRPEAGWRRRDHRGDKDPHVGDSQWRPGCGSPRSRSARDVEVGFVRKFDEFFSRNLGNWAPRGMQESEDARRASPKASG